MSEDFFLFFFLLPTSESKQSKTTPAPIHTERRPGEYLTSEKLMIAVFVEGALLIVALVIIGMLLFKLRVKQISDQSKCHFYSKQLCEEETIVSSKLFIC